MCVETALTLDWPHVDHSLKPLSNKNTKLVWTLYLHNVGSNLAIHLSDTPFIIQ